MIKWWSIKCNEKDALFTEWINRGIVSIGWKEVGNPKDYETKDKLLIRCDQVYSEKMPIYRIQTESQLWKFSREINAGDIILSYRKADEQYYFGIVDKCHEYIPEMSDDYPNVIKVNWLKKTIPEKMISKEIKNYLSSSASVSQILQYEEKLQKLLDYLQDENNVQASDDNGISLVKKIYLHNSKLVKNLETVQFIIIIKEIIKVLGYNIDDIGESDHLYSFNIWFEDPLKLHKSEAMVGILKNKKVYQYKDIESILKLDLKNDKLILISSDGFAASVKENMEKDKVRLVESSDLISFIFENYSSFSENVKDILYLKKVYV